MASAPVCVNEFATEHYSIYIAFNAIIILLMLVLLIHTIAQRGCRSKSRVDGGREGHMMYGLYIVLQLVALYWLITDCLRYSIDPHTSILRGSFLCKFSAYSSYYIPGIFYGLYLYQILLRLDTSFRGSYLELSKCSLYTLRTLVLLIPIVSTLTMIIDNVVGDDHHCINHWYPSDQDHVITVCAVEASLLFFWRYHIVDAAVANINVQNIMFGVIFAVKLRQIINLGTTSDPHEASKYSKLKELVIKNNILVIVGCVSTTAGYALWFFTRDMWYLYSDLYINCLVIGLMFSRNELYYKRMCGPCIWICRRKCRPKRNIGKLEGEMVKSMSMTPTTSLSNSPSKSMGI